MNAAYVQQTERRIPMTRETDVVVVGGTVSAVAAAVAAAEAGCRVLLVAPRPYLGEDMCATLRLWLEPEEKPAPGTLVQQIFAKGSPTTPMRVKKTLEAALLEKKVEFLLCSYGTDVLTDAGGNPAGVVIANRAGRQAIAAKVIIDATERGTVARLAGANLRPASPGERVFSRVVLAKQLSQNAAPIDRIPLGDPKQEGVQYNVYELRLDLPTDSMSAFAAAEQMARDATYTDGQLRAAERLFSVPASVVVCALSADGWKDADPSGYLRPEGVERVYVLSGAADAPRAAAERLMRPVLGEKVGRLIGAQAAGDAEQLPPPEPVRLRDLGDLSRGSLAGRAPGRLTSSAPQGAKQGAADVNQPAAHEEQTGKIEIRELLHGLRPSDRTERSVLSDATEIPVLGEYDVVVVGGGTSGAPAAIGAARQGARVLVLEYQEGLGGMGTVGLIGKPYHGKKIGFSEEVPFPGEGKNVEHKMEWYRRELRKAGADIWFGVIGCGAVVQGNRVIGAVVATPDGRGAVLGKVVIDASGNADIAVAAGADYRYGSTDDGDIGMQGAGLPPRPLGKDYVNTDYLLVDEADMIDVWRTLTGALMTMSEHAYDMGTLIQTRERRRVVGEHVLTYIDQIARRTYPDSIVCSTSDYDSHGYPSSDYFALLPHDEKSKQENHPAPGGSCYTPYRCLIPKGLEGLLVTGLGISMERDASALVRMQYDIQNQGYAAGVAAAMAARYSRGVREIDVHALQEHLVETGGLDKDVLDHEDSYPLPEKEVRVAAAALGAARNPNQAGRPLAIVLSQPNVALPLLREAHAKAASDAKLVYARILGFMGEGTVVPELVAALEVAGPWEPRIKQGNMAEFAHLPTPVDTLILALGRTRDRRAVTPILERLETLDSDTPMSHHRAVAMALEALAAPVAAAPLARLLNKPGMRGHAMTELEPLHDQPRGKRRRIPPLREIVLARALYRCGDHNGLAAAILDEYRRDIRGLFAQHAASVLGR